ncbi:restriction endonuclease subunit S [Ruminobacter sp.]|uniref:restriction endonuclease subunit S n=1 Tax=Ruminobacter sp. TaxID=2774296 RepID=UPI003868E126
MNKITKVPKLRFPKFTDEWEQRKLGDVVERVTRKNSNLESNLPLTISAQYGLIDQNEFFDRRIASKDVSGYYLIKHGEFAYNKSTSNDAEWGAIKRLDRYEKGVLSTLYIVFKILDEKQTSSDFLATYYDTNLWHKGIQAIAAEGARNHGLLNIAPSDFFNTSLMMPKSYEEQNKIGEFFLSLNKLITLHQRKLDNLNNIKKSMLGKLFPKKGEKYPEVRFEGFTSEWEQRKLKDIASFIRGSFPQPYTNPDFYDEKEGKPFVQVADIGMGLELNKDTKTHISRIAESKSRFVKAGTVIVALQGSIETSIGRTAITQYDAFVDRTILIFESYRIPIDKTFFAQSIKKLFQKEKEKAWGATISTITKEHLSDFILGIPSLDEQAKIGLFFKNIDNIITLHQRKLDNLNNIKKGFLQQMFA